METLTDFIDIGKEYMEKLPAPPTKHYIPDWLIAEITKKLLEDKKCL